MRTADLLVSRAFDAMDVVVTAPTAQQKQQEGQQQQLQQQQTQSQQSQSQQSSTSQQQSSFPASLVGYARAATRQCNDLPRLLDAACLLCHLLAYPNPCRLSAYQGVLVLLANKYPKV